MVTIDLSDYLQVSITNVRDYGTLLQDAVCEGKADFVRIMLESGFVCIDYDLKCLLK